METVLENGPPIGWHTFSTDMICLRMLMVPTFPPMNRSNSIFSFKFFIGKFYTKEIKRSYFSNGINCLKLQISQPKLH